MTQYFMNEGVFDLPDLGFVDQTVHLFSAKVGDGAEIGLLVTRSPIPKGKSLKQLVDAHVANEQKTLRAFAVLAEREAEWAGVVALEVASRYRSGHDMAYQRQVHLLAYGAWLLFGATAPLDKRGAADECLESVLASFRLRER